MKFSRIIFPALIIALLTSLTLFYSCTNDSASPVFGDYPTDVGKIFTYKCATSGCHNTASYKGAADLDLSTLAALFKGSSNGSPVIPYSSEFSSLCYFINTYDEFGPKNIPTMPLNGSALSKSEVKTIKDWIDAGAPDVNGKIMWADDPLRKKYYVLNQGCDVVTVFDAATQLPMRYIKVGNSVSSESPHMVRVSPDGKYWYVVFVANNILQKYRTSDDSFVGEVNLGAFQNWNTITISNDSKRAYCVSWQPNSRLAVVNLDNMTLKNNVGGFINAHGIALNNTNDTIYMTAQTGNYIYKMDTGLNVINTVVLDVPATPINNTSSLDPHEIAFSPDGSKYFVTCQGYNEVRVMSTVGDNLLQVISTGVFPQEIARSITKNKIYVSCTNDPNSNSRILGSVTVIDMSTYTTTNYKVGYQVHGIGLDEVNGLVIVSSRNIVTNGPAPHHTGVCGRNGFVNYFTINTMQLLDKKTEVASDPYSVAVRP